MKVKTKTTKTILGTEYKKNKVHEVRESEGRFLVEKEGFEEVKE